MSMKELGFWLSIPDSPVIVVIPLVAYVSDYIRQKQKYSLTTVSKLFQCIAGFGPAICLFLIPFSDTPMLVIGLLTMATIFQTFCCGSLLINPLDLAPEYASVIMGMVTTSGCLSAMISPTLTGYIVGHQSREGWTTTFIISGATYVIASLIYLLFASAEKQTWATSDHTRITDAVKL